MADKIPDTEPFYVQQVFAYNEDEFITYAGRNVTSRFDQILQSSWNEAMNAGYFNYKIGDLKTKIVSSKFGYVVQLNVKRATERRKPFPFSKIYEPFKNESFNFKKINEREILFELQPKHWQHLKKKEGNPNISPMNLIIINVSPLEYCHSLLVPDLYSDCPQVLTSNCLRLAIETLLLSSDLSLRLGFNSLGAFASINHLHFHLYYLKEPLFIETSPVGHLAGGCYEIKDFPAEGFAFQLPDTDILKVVSAVMRLVSFLHGSSIAHNVFITRGNAFMPEEKAHKVVRIFVWARHFYSGAKDDFSFNAAVCELAGHIPIKGEMFYETVTENDVASIIHSACHDIFCEIRDKVKQLFLSS